MENKCKCTDNPKYKYKGGAWSLTDRSGNKVCFRCGTIVNEKGLDITPKV